MSFFRKPKRYFHSYKEKTHTNNELLAYKRLLNGLCEIIYWNEAYEVYYRPKGKRYGQLLASFDSLERAYKYFNMFNENILEKVNKNYDK
ncbi:MAG: hypothetical protein BWY30_00967 [Tenericutes bacterium ADurb.Bin239]|nr:MAG: hypothetical protein BWY30_00967 [Tenericutes bacterium ADurb.Bin239]